MSASTDFNAVHRRSGDAATILANVAFIDTTDRRRKLNPLCDVGARQ
jgi:hypothetical protein